MYFDKQKGIKVLVTHGLIGPTHDPYGTHCVQVNRADKAATLYNDGLGRFCLTLYEGGKVLRRVEWVDSSRGPKSVNRSICAETKANLLARRHVGVRFDEAEEFFNRNWQPDPMGGPSRYI